jgi:hypothetical protein
MKVRLVFALAVVLVSSITWTTQPSLAQTKFKSGISGRVTDRNGAVVVTATVTLVARTTKKLVHVKTNDVGEYAVDLEPDIYDVQAEAPGFKKAKRKYIPVQSEARSLVDFVLVPREN